MNDGVVKPILLFTDASFCRHTKLASYGAILRYDQKCITDRGLIKPPVASANIAEMYAAAYAIQFGVRQQAIAQDSTVVLHTDSTYVGYHLFPSTERQINRVNMKVDIPGFLVARNIVTTLVTKLNLNVTVVCISGKVHDDIGAAHHSARDTLRHHKRQLGYF